MINSSPIGNLLPCYRIRLGKKEKGDDRSQGEANLIKNFNKNSKSEVKVPQECKKSLKRKKIPQTMNYVICS